MESTLTSKNINLLCRICLTLAKNLTHLTTVVDADVMHSKNSKTVQKMLETVTFSKIVIDDDNFPSKICQMCLSLLKISYEFQMQFRNSQNVLKNARKCLPLEALNGSEKVLPVQNKSSESNLTKEVPVELIYGKNKFDLNDIIVIEEEENENFSFEGFLNNLGTEISAKFVNNNRCSNSNDHNHLVRNITQHDNEVVVEPLNVSKQLDKELQIIIEEVSELKSDDCDDNAKLITTLFECKTCKKLFNSYRELKTHIGSCFNQPPQFMCDKCGHISHSNSAHYHHLQKHKGKRFKCDQCPKRYDTSSRLKVHKEIHKNERPYLCNVCGKNFNYAISLKYHMRLHTGEKKYVCNFCGLKYTMSNTLQRHLRTHTKDKPYQCKYCHKRFPSCGEKNCHEMLHTGLRPYRCEYCSKGYTKSASLQSHYLTHSGPHECFVCLKTFIDVKFLRIHLKRVHKLINNDEAQK